MSALIRIPEMHADDGVRAPKGDVDRLVHFMRRHGRLLALTGAGISTHSGIPAYRDRNGRWLQRRPVLYQDFVGSARTRQRYWARSYIGWPLMQTAQPNAAHHSLARLEQAGRVQAVVTQNVDGLHGRAGQQTLMELHGRLDEVRCLACGNQSRRDELQLRLAALNPGWHAAHGQVNADGDVELAEDAWQDFQPPSCERCGGSLKPEVVFFGESVPAATRSAVEQALAQARALLVVGSSLVVGSAFQLVRRAASQGLPVAAINQGRTRADGLLEFKLEAPAEVALTALLEA